MRDKLRAGCGVILVLLISQSQRGLSGLRNVFFNYNNNNYKALSFHLIKSQLTSNWCEPYTQKFNFFKTLMLGEILFNNFQLFQ